MNILIIRTSALGDIVHSLPVLSALRRQLPEARIGWVVEKVFAPLLNDHPWVDEVFEVRMRPWRKRFHQAETRGEVRRALSAIRRFRADVAIDLMGNHKGGLLARLSGAKRTVGAARQDRREGSSAVWIGQRVPTPSRHAVDRYLDILSALDIDPQHRDGPPADFAPQHILPYVPDSAEAVLEQCPRPFVIIQAGAGWGNKTYPPAWWGAVARGLAEDPGIDVRVPIAPGEEHLAQAIVDTSDGAAVAVDAKGFPLLAALLRRSALVLGGDTGPVHLAHALEVPVVCVIGPTDPWRNGPYRDDESILWKELPCSNCYKRYAEPRECLLGIPPSAVLARARGRLLSSPSATGMGEP